MKSKRMRILKILVRLESCLFSLFFAYQDFFGWAPPPPSSPTYVPATGHVSLDGFINRFEKCYQTKLFVFINNLRNKIKRLIDITGNGLLDILLYHAFHFIHLKLLHFTVCYLQPKQVYTFLSRKKINRIK